jgi:hypothetical protein
LAQASLILDNWSSSSSKMPNLQEIKSLVKISSISENLPETVPEGSPDDKLSVVMTGEEANSPWETLNWRFDAVFEGDCRDENGHFHHLRQRIHGMGAVCRSVPILLVSSGPIRWMESESPGDKEVEDNEVGWDDDVEDIESSDDLNVLQPRTKRPNDILIELKHFYIQSHGFQARPNRNSTTQGKSNLCIRV